MHAAWIWASREIRRGWLSLLVVALLVGITGGTVMAGVAGARRAGSAVDRYLLDTGLSDVTIYTQSLDPRVRALMDEDDRVRAVQDLAIVLMTPQSLEPGIEAATVVVPDSYWGELVRPRLLAGRYPVGADEIAVTEQLALEHGYAVGRSLDLHVLRPEQAWECIGRGTCTTTMAGRATISAVLRTPSDLAPGPFSDGLFLAPQRFLDARGGDDVRWGIITDLFLTDSGDTDAVVRDYSVEVDNGDVADEDSDDVVGIRHATGLQRNALLIGSAIAAAAGLLIGGQAFGRFLTRRASDASTLAAIGMPAGQRLLTGFLPGAVGSMLGAALAVPIAIALSPLFPLRVARRTDPDVGVHADWGVLLVGSSIVLVVGAVAALISSALWARRRPARRSTTTLSAIAGLADRLRLGPAPSMGSRFALESGRGVRRAPVVPSLIGASVAVLVVVGALVISSSLDGLLATPDRYGAAWNVQATTASDYDAVVTGLADDDRVDGVSVAVSGELTLSNQGAAPVQGFTLGLDSVKGSVDPVVLEGRTPVGSNEILVGSTTMRRQGIEVGDEVEISGPGGTTTVVVVGRTVVPVVSASSPDEGMVVPLETFMTLRGTETVAEIDVEATVLATTEEAHVGAVGGALEATGATLDGPFRQASVTSLGEVRAIPLYLAGFAAFIGTLSVFHTLFVTSRRRRSDLAILRALGFRPGQASGVINWQGFFLGLVAMLIGCPAGIIAGRLLWTAVAMNTNVLAVVDIPWSPIVGFGALVLLSSAVLLAAGPAWTARRRSPGADLRAE